MIIGGIFVEIRTPGIGLPLITAILGAVLYFAPAYMGHLAEHWEILLFVVGLVLIALEIFVIPGFGVCGVSGIVCIIASLSLAIVDNGTFRQLDGSLTLQPLIRPLAIVVTSCMAAVLGSLWIVSKLYTTRSFDHIALRQEMKSEEGFTGVVSGLEQLVGQSVTVFTDMRPGGKVITSDGRIHEATLKFGCFVSKGETLRVVSAEQGRLYCEKS
jgi:membrane-bound serine protease (ClpP class)